MESFPAGLPLPERGAHLARLLARSHSLRRHAREVMERAAGLRQRSRELLRTSGSLRGEHEDAGALRWYRMQVRQMLAAGWTPAELADVGITAPLLRELGLGGTE